jgi:hypothetical protein
VLNEEPWDDLIAMNTFFAKFDFRKNRIKANDVSRVTE